MSRTAIFLTNDSGLPIKVLGSSDSIWLEHGGRTVQPGEKQVLIAAIGDPGWDEGAKTGEITLQAPNAQGVLTNCNVEVRKNKGEQMEFLSLDNNRLFTIVDTNDFANEPKSVYSTSVTLHVAKSVYYNNPPS